MLRPEEVGTGVEITSTVVGTDSLAESESDISVDTLDISPRQGTYPMSKQYHLLNINSVSAWPTSAPPISNKYKQLLPQIISKYSPTVFPDLLSVGNCLSNLHIHIQQTDKMETELPTDKHLGDLQIL